MAQFMKNIQIQSALIWAITIIALACFGNSYNSFIILITAAGLHSTILSRYVQNRTQLVE